MPNEFWTVLEEIQQKRQEADEKGRQFLAGREIADLTDDELNQLFEITDNFFDPRNPEHRAIQENRRIYHEWEDYLKTVNDRSHIDSTDMDNEFGLNMHIINREYYHQPQLAGPYNGDDFLLKLQSCTAFTHDHRKLAMHPSIAYAVADPDELIDNDERAASYGVMFLGSFAYDMTLDVTLDLSDYDWDATTFSLYFALKASKISFVEVSKFLEYQLEQTFKSDLSKFKIFLKALMRQYRTIEVGDAQKEIICQDLSDTINEWLDVFTSSDNNYGEKNVIKGSIIKVDGNFRLGDDVVSGNQNVNIVHNYFGNQKASENTPPQYSSLKTQLQTLIKKEKIEEALELFMDEAKKQGLDCFDELLLLSARFNRVQRSERKGIDNPQTERNRINDALITLIKDLE